jgi:putative addiction module killer protein
MIEIRKTETFAQWLDGLRDLRARARVQVRIERLAAGNAGDVKAVGKVSLNCESITVRGTEYISPSGGVRW